MLCFSVGYFLFVVIYIYTYNEKELYCHFVLENLKIWDERKKKSCTHSHIFQVISEGDCAVGW